MHRAKESKSIFYRDFTEVTDQIESVKESIKELADNQEELASVIGESGMFRTIISYYENELKELKKHKEELAEIRTILMGYKGNEYSDGLCGDLLNDVADEYVEHEKGLKKY